MRDSPKPDEDAFESAAGLDSLPTPEAHVPLGGAFADDGVDLTLILWMLQLSPAERLQAAQDMVDAVWELRVRSEA